MIKRQGLVGLGIGVVVGIVLGGALGVWISRTTVSSNDVEHANVQTERQAPQGAKRVTTWKLLRDLRPGEYGYASSEILHRTADGTWHIYEMHHVFPERCGLTPQMRVDRTQDGRLEVSLRSDDVPTPRPEARYEWDLVVTMTIRDGEGCG